MFIIAQLIAKGLLVLWVSLRFWGHIEKDLKEYEDGVIPRVLASITVLIVALALFYLAGVFTLNLN